MTRIAAAALLSLTPLSMAQDAGPLQWHTDFRRAAEVARKRRLPILAYVFDRT